MSSYKLTTQVSLDNDKTYKKGNAILKDSSLDQLSFQNLIIIPLPTLKEVLLMKSYQSYLIAFYTLTSYPFLTLHEC